MACPCGAPPRRRRSRMKAAAGAAWRGSGPPTSPPCGEREREALLRRKQRSLGAIPDRLESFLISGRSEKEEAVFKPKP